MRRQSSVLHCPGKRLNTKRRKRESITFTLAVAFLLFCTGFVSWCGVDFSEKVSAQPLVSSGFAVNSTEDPGSGLVNCNLRGFKCTLRAAISAANLASGDDTITFAIPTNDPNCNSSGQCTINLTSQLPDLSTNINITGPGQNNLTVRRNTGGS
jgi:hypothetical protein